MIFIPEKKIYQTLLNLFKFVRVDFADNSNEQNTFLYYLFGGDVDDNKNANYFKMSKELFISRNNDSPRKVEVSYGFNGDRADSPTIHILLPSESEQNKGIGNNIGFEDFDINELTSESVENMTTSFNSQFNLLLTSNSQVEVIIMYNFLKSMLFALRYDMELNGFQNVTLTGNDMMFNQEFLPNTFSRNFNINFTYDFTVKGLYYHKIIESLSANGDIIN